MEPKTTHKRSYLVSAVSSFMFLAALLSSVSAFLSPVSMQLGPVFQGTLIVASVWTFAAAVGVWMHRRWGAYLYFALVAASQIALAAMGQWNGFSPIIPGIVVILLILCFPSLAGRGVTNANRSGTY